MFMSPDLYIWELVSHAHIHISLKRTAHKVWERLHMFIISLLLVSWMQCKFLSLVKFPVVEASFPGSCTITVMRCIGQRLAVLSKPAETGESAEGCTVDRHENLLC